MKSCAIDDEKNSSDASVCRSEPRLGVSKGQREIRVNTGGFERNQGRSNGLNGNL